MEYRNAEYSPSFLGIYSGYYGKKYYEYDFIKNVYSLQIQCGIIVFKTKHFSIDFYGGTGIRYMQLLYRTLSVHPADMQIHYKEDEEESMFFPIFPMGINLGYIIN